MLFKFPCYFPAEKPVFFVINIESDAWVSELLEAAGEGLRLRGRKVSVEDLRLFIVNLFFI